MTGGHLFGVTTRRGRNSREKPMENAGIQKQQTAGTSSTARPMWDPFWFMRAMLSWARPADAPSFDVKETDDTYVCKVKLALPNGGRRSRQGGAQGRRAHPARAEGSRGRAGARVRVRPAARTGLDVGVAESPSPERERSPWISQTQASAKSAYVSAWAVIPQLPVQRHHFGVVVDVRFRGRVQ